MGTFIKTDREKGKDGQKQKDLTIKHSFTTVQQFNALGQTNLTKIFPGCLFGKCLCWKPEMWYIILVKMSWKDLQ